MFLYEQSRTLKGSISSENLNNKANYTDQMIIS